MRENQVPGRESPTLGGGQLVDRRVVRLGPDVPAEHEQALDSVGRVRDVIGLAERRAVKTSLGVGLNDLKPRLAVVRGLGF